MSGMTDPHTKKPSRPYGPVPVIAEPAKVQCRICSGGFTHDDPPMIGRVHHQCIVNLHKRIKETV